MIETNNRYSTIPIYHTACFFPDESIGIVARTKLYRFSPDGKQSSYIEGINNPKEIARSNNEVIVSCIDTKQKRQMFYNVPSEAEKHVNLIGLSNGSTMLVGPNGEVIGRSKGHLQMIYPQKIDLTSGYHLGCVGGNTDQLIIWRWNSDNRTLFSEIRDVKHGYALISSASYKPEASRKLLLASDWRYLGKVLGKSLLFALLALAITALSFRILPGKIRYGFAAVIIGFAYKIGFADLSSVTSSSQLIGASVGFYLILNLIILTSIISVCWLTRRYIRFSMADGGWSIPGSIKGWAFGLIPIGLLLGRYFITPSHPETVNPAYLSFLVVYFFGVVALWEEFVFRGLLWHQLSLIKWRIPVVIVQALLFSLFHYRLQTSIAYQQIKLGDYIYLFILGLSFGAMRLHSKSIFPCWVVHGLYNVLSFSIYPLTYRVMFNLNNLR